MLHLTVPGDGLDVLEGLRLGAGCHWGGSVVQVPDEDLGFRGGRGEQVALERIVIQRGDRAVVLV